VKRYQRAQHLADLAAERARKRDKKKELEDREYAANEAYVAVMDSLLWDDWDINHP
jgi:hypothetical protein